MSSIRLFPYLFGFLHDDSLIKSISLNLSLTLDLIMERLCWSFHFLCFRQSFLDTGVRESSLHLAYFLHLLLIFFLLGRFSLFQICWKIQYSSFSFSRKLLGRTPHEKGQCLELARIKESLGPKYQLYNRKAFLESFQEPYTSKSHTMCFCITKWQRNQNRTAWRGHLLLIKCSQANINMSVTLISRCMYFKECKY